MTHDAMLQISEWSSITTAYFEKNLFNGTIPNAVLAWESIEYVYSVAMWNCIHFISPGLHSPSTQQIRRVLLQ